MSRPEAVANQVIERCRSTNDLARELGEKGAPHGTWISARAQDAGRGRLGRVWDSREGNLFISWVLRPADKSRWTWIPLTIAVAVARAIGARGVPLKVKWPNDLLSEAGAKVGGILCEAVGASHGSFIVAGLGLNCAHAPEALDQATSCLTDLAAGRGDAFGTGPITADDVRAAIHEELIQLIERMVVEGPASVRAEYETLAAFPRGTSVSWISAGTEHFGVVDRLGDLGELLVDEGACGPTRLYAEDVKIRRR